MKRDPQKNSMIPFSPENQILANIKMNGIPEGTRKMFVMEKEASKFSMETGNYVVFRNTQTKEGFCNHTLSEHDLNNPLVKCKGCKCKSFQYMFMRPEEIGEPWIVGRRDFDINSWFPKCRCKHSPSNHTPVTMRCRTGGCGCYRFSSHFCCVVCNKFWEEHETVVQTERERRMEKKPVGRDYIPFEEIKPIQNFVFNGPTFGAKKKKKKKRLMIKGKKKD